MEISIRPVTPGDEAAFLELACGLTMWNLPHRPADDNLEQRLRQRRQNVTQIFLATSATRTLLLAYRGDLPAGYVLAYLENDNGRGIGYIDELFVTDAVRGLGAGRQLMEAAVAELKAGGASVLRLNVFYWNEAARGFYEKLGYQPYSVVYQKQI